jgi:hypothetical protein
MCAYIVLGHFSPLPLDYLLSVLPEAVRNAKLPSGVQMGYVSNKGKCTSRHSTKIFFLLN